jgi:hypothetical protein
VTVDEMDLVSQLKEAAPLRPAAYERARATLRAAMAGSGPARRPEMVPVPGAAPVREEGFSLARKRRGTVGTLGKVGIGAGIGAVAAAVAVVLVATSTPRSAAPAGSSTGASTGSAAQPPTATSPLMTLAAHIQASDTSPLPGNASLVIEDKKDSAGKTVEVVYALYTDSGILYTGDGKQTLMSSITQPMNPANNETYRWAVSARNAASGDLATARLRMINTFPNCFGLGLSPTAQKKIRANCWAAGAALRREKMGDKAPTKQPTAKQVQSEIDNTLWVACDNALSWAGGDPRIREGVLRLLSTLPEVTVANSTTDGEPTLTITGGPGLFDDGSYHEVDTVDAKTGMPVSSMESGGGMAPSTQFFQFSRVTLADVKAGKF